MDWSRGIKIGIHRQAWGIKELEEIVLTLEMLAI